MSAERDREEEEQLIKDLLDVALVKKQAVVVSRVGAVAQTFRERGGGTLREVFRRVSGSSVAKDVNSCFAELAEDGKQKFLQGFGFVLVGCTLAAIENGIIEGWDDKYYLELFNFDISGTPIPLETLQTLKEQARYEPTNPNQETTRLRELVIRDRSFCQVFNQEELQLPQVVVAHLKTFNPNIISVFGWSIRIYSEVIQKMPQSEQNN